MKEYIKKVAITVLVALLVIAAFVLASFSLYTILPFFIPFFIAYLLAILLEPLNQLLSRVNKINRLGAVTITYVVSVGLISLLTFFAVTKIFKELISLLQFIQKNIPAIQDWFAGVYNQVQNFILLFPPEISSQINKSFQTFTQKLANIDIVSNVGNYALKISTSIPNLFILTIIVFVSLFFFSLYLPSIHNNFLNLFKKKKQDIINVLLNEVKMATIGFLRAQIILSSITYLISFITLTILGVKYALAISLLIIIVDLLPILGTGSTLGPWAVFSIVRGDIFLGIGLLVLFVVITVVRKAIEPRILGARIGLGPLATLISIWIGFKALGIIGVLVGPLLVILFKSLVKIGVISKNLKI